MTLDQFIRNSLDRPPALGHARAHVVEPGFETLYVRLGRRVIEQAEYRPVLDIATVTVDEHLRGRGLFTDLLDRVRDQHPTLHIYVENAMDPRFQKHLERCGFAVVQPRLDPPCYFLLAGSP